MPQGTGTRESIRQEAAELDIELDIPVQTPVDLEVDPLPSLMEGQGIPGKLPFLERFEAASAVGSPTYNVITGLADEYEAEIDLEYKPEDHPELFTGVPEDLYDHILEATSATDAQHRLQQIQEENEQMKAVMQDGAISGIAYTMLAGTVADPIFWATIRAEGAVGMQVLSKGMRMGRLAALSQTSRIGLAAGAAAAFETSILADQRATVDAEDVMYAGITGLAMGTAGGAAMQKFLRSNDFDKAADAVQHNFSTDVSKQMDNNLMANQMEIKGPKSVYADESESVFGRYDPEDAAARAADTPADEAVMELSDEAQELSYKEAYRTNIADRRANGTFNPEEITESKTFKVLEKNPLMSDFTKLFRSKSDQIKFFASEMLENASGSGTRVKTAAVLKHITERKFLQGSMPVLRKGYRDFAKANGIKMVDPEYWNKGLKQFNTEVRLELEKYRNAAARGVEYKSVAPSYVQESSTAWRKNMKEMAEHARASGVKGFDEFKILDGYVPLVWRGKDLIKADAAGLLPRYSRMLQKGYELAGISAKDAKVITKAVFNRQMKKAVGIDTNPGVLLSRDSREFLRESLEINGLSEGQMKALFGRIDTAMAEQGKSARAKGRVPIDLTVTDKELSLIDLVDNDLASVGSRYFTEMSGRSAMARKGITNDGAWRAVRNSMIDDAIQAGDQNVERLTKIIDGTYQQFLGQPVGAGIHRGVRRLQELAMTSMLGTVGVAQMAESANVIAAHGLANIMKYAPDVRNFRKSIKSGEVPDSLMGEIYAHLGGMWDEHLYYRPGVRLDQAAGNDDGMFHVLDNVLGGAKEALGWASGMNYIKNVQQQVTAISQANRVIGMLKKGGTDDALLKRFASVGWDESTLARIKQKITDGTVTFQDNGSIDRLNLGAWDAKLVEDFSIGMQRHSAQLIQFPMIGETSYWQHKTFGSMMTQFRSFSMLAIEKQTARNLRIADKEAVAAFTYSLGLSAMLYMGKVHATSVGRPDREEYLEKRLNTAAMLNGALQWSGVFSIASEGVNAMSATGLLPADWGSGSVGRGGVASFSMDKQVPAVSTALSGLKLGAGLLESIAPFGEHEFGKQEVNNFFASLPLGNIYPAIVVKNVLRGAVDEDD